MFGQVGYFQKFDGRHIQDKRPLQRYVDESKRLFGILDTRLDGRQWIMGDEYTIADVATFPWVRNLQMFYEADPVIGFKLFPRTMEWMKRASERPASVKAFDIPARG